MKARGETGGILLKILETRMPVAYRGDGDAVSNSAQGHVSS
jgi:hypothetical protein